MSELKVLSTIKVSMVEYFDAGNAYIISKKNPAK